MTGCPVFDWSLLTVYSTHGMGGACSYINASMTYEIKQRKPTSCDMEAVTLGCNCRVTPIMLVGSQL
jgi:hypothetical protein